MSTDSTPDGASKPETTNAHRRLVSTGDIGGTQSTARTTDIHNNISCVNQNAHARARASHKDGRFVFPKYIVIIIINQGISIFSKIQIKIENIMPKE